MSGVRCNIFSSYFEVGLDSTHQYSQAAHTIALHTYVTDAGRFPMPSLDVSSLSMCLANFRHIFGVLYHCSELLNYFYALLTSLHRITCA